MCEDTIDAMAEEIEVLKARCARLRAALAQMLMLGGDINDVGYLKSVEMAMSGPDFWDSIPAAALEVLRETAEEVPHAD